MKENIGKIFKIKNNSGNFWHLKSNINTFSFGKLPLEKDNVFMILDYYYDSSNLKHWIKILYKNKIGWDYFYKMEHFNADFEMSEK